MTCFFWGFYFEGAFILGVYVLMSHSYIYIYILQETDCSIEPHWVSVNCRLSNRVTEDKCPIMAVNRGAGAFEGPWEVLKVVHWTAVLVVFIPLTSQMVFHLIPTTTALSVGLWMDCSCQQSDHVLHWCSQSPEDRLALNIAPMRMHRTHWTCAFICISSHVHWCFFSHRSECRCLFSQFY